MTKGRVLLVVVAVSLAGLFPPTGPFPQNSTALAADPSRWYAVDTPARGEAGGWVLADGEISHITQASDGTLYCISLDGGAERIFRSTDTGARWSALAAVSGTVTDLAVAPDDPNAVYYATVSTVHRSDDGGVSFTPLPSGPGGSGGGSIGITSIDVTGSGADRTVAASTSDGDAGEYGGVYVLDEADLPSGWADTGIGDYDVRRVAFSPRYGADGQLVAIATDETDGFVMTRLGNNAWGADTAAAVIPGIVPQAAVVSFPDGFSATTDGSVFFAGLDTGSGTGDVFSVTRQGGTLVATDLDVGAGTGQANVDVSGLAVSGSGATATLLAGAAQSGEVYSSTNGGQTWAASDKAPTGQWPTRVLMAPDFATSGRAYAATTGASGAFSRSTDGGAVWNQSSLILALLSDIVDVAVAPNCSVATLFMITFDGTHSLWRTANDGATWERVLSSHPATVDSLARVIVSPEYGQGSWVIFVYGESGGNPTIWRSADGGDTFEAATAPLAVDAWAAAGDDSLYFGGYDGTDGIVYEHSGGAFLPAGGTAVGPNPLYSITLSPDFDRDRSMLVGDRLGQAYWSEDGGEAFRALGQQLDVHTTSGGDVSTAFDPQFASNRTVYAATTSLQGEPTSIFRLDVGSSEVWEPICRNMPLHGILEMAVSDGGVLYALRWGNQVDHTNGYGGVERALNPRHVFTQTTESVPTGLPEGAELANLRVCGNRLWAIDTKNDRLVSYRDTLSGPVILAQPEHKQPGIGIRNVRLDWAAAAGATKYEWQLDHDNSFDHVPEGFSGETAASSVQLPALQPGTTYHWRVRAVKPVLSRWSRKQSFATVLGDPDSPIELLSPAAGETGASLQPVFQWSAIAGADRYELAVATDTGFENIIITPTRLDQLPTTAWQCDAPLSNGTTYYWKVRGHSDDSFSAWSAVGAFVTEPARPEPQEAGAPPVTATPPEPDATKEEQSAPGPEEPEEKPVSGQVAATESIPTPPEKLEIVFPESMLAPTTSVEFTVPGWAIGTVIGLLALVAVLLSAVLVAMLATVRKLRNG